MRVGVLLHQRPQQLDGTLAHLCVWCVCVSMHVHMKERERGHKGREEGKGKKMSDILDGVLPGPTYLQDAQWPSAQQQAVSS